MPPDRFVLLVGIVLALAGATVWLALRLWPSADMPWLTPAVLSLLGLVAWLVLRGIADRRARRGNDRHDRTGE